MTKRAAFRTFTFLTLLTVILAPATARSQDLKYTMVTRAEFGGATGRILGAMPGASDPTSETTFIKGNRIRKDESPESSSIMDWDSGTLTLLDHAGKSYVQLSLEEMARAAEEMVQAMEGRSEEVGEAAVEGSREKVSDAGNDQLAMEVKVSSDRTGRTRDFSGYTAEQVLITLEILGDDAPADVPEEEGSGGLAIVTELWLSQDFPEYRLMQEMDGAALSRMKKQETGEGILGSLEEFLNSDPRMKVAFEKNQETVGAMEGVALRTTIHVVGLPGSMPVDRDKVLADQERSLSADAADAAKSGVGDAARSAMGQVSGRLFGRKKREEAPPEPEEPQQSVMMRMISEVSDVQLQELDAALFEPPAEYFLAVQEGTTGSGG